MKSNREVMICTRVTESEREELKDRAKMTNKSVSNYIRSLALNYPITSKVDLLTLKELELARGDMGRLGGLFKLWLVENADIKHIAKLGDKGYTKIDQLVNDLLDAQERLEMISKRVLESL